MNTPDTSQPLVTVVTVTFNLVKAGRRECFRQCVESVHAQTYGAIEHLVIDGASNDGTLELIAGYEAKGWLTCHSEPDEGLYDAMNKGIRRARGKYVAFLNSDDFWHDTRGVEASVRALEESGADFSYGSCTMVTETGKKAYEMEPHIERFFCEMPFVHQTMFCRTEVLRSMGGFDGHLFSLSADYDLITRIILNRCRSVRVPLNFTSFRVGGVSCNQGESSAEQSLRVQQRHYSHLIGEAEVARLSSGIFPASLPSALASQLSPEILWHMGRCLKEAVHYDYCEFTPRQTSRLRWAGPLGIPFISRCSANDRTVWRLFDLLPLLTVETVVRRSYVREMRWLLLGGLPLWKCVSRFSFTVKHYLFFFFPIWSCRRR